MSFDLIRKSFKNIIDKCQCSRSDELKDREYFNKVIFKI